jgi:DDE superfamily endonuclease
MLAPSRDAAFEIIDAIAASRDARSAVEISLSPTMERKFSSVYKGIERTRIDEENLRPLLVKQAEASGELLFDGRAIYALDHTPYPRPTAPTVSDRGYVHGANGREVGHRYSLLGRVMHESGSWVGIVDVERIATHQSPSRVGAAQIDRLKTTATIPCIISADSEYPTAWILDQADEQTYLLIRLRGNNKLYGEPEPRPPGKRGAPPKHGNKIKLNRPETLGQPAHHLRVEEADGGWVMISVWERMHFKSRPERPWSVVRVECFKANGERRFQDPLWLVWTGPTQIDWATLWKVYLKRFRLECVHQFTKNSLAWTRGRFGYTGREERWTWLVILAYWQLLLAAPLVREVCRPWEKPTPEGKPPTPARVQRVYLKFFDEIGSPTRSPKVRGIPPGRAPGYRPPPRTRFRVVYKRRGGSVTTL